MAYQGRRRGGESPRLALPKEAAFRHMKKKKREEKLREKNTKKDKNKETKVIFTVPPMYNAVMVLPVRPTVGLDYIDIRVFHTV